MTKKKFAVCSTLLKDIQNGYNIMTDLRMIEAISKEEAIGKYTIEVSEQFKEHQIYVRPLAMEIELKTNGS